MAGPAVKYYDTVSGTWKYLLQGPQGPAGAGNVSGPGSSTDNAVTRFDGTTGQLIQNSTVTVADDGTIGLPFGTITSDAGGITITPNGTDVNINSSTNHTFINGAVVPTETSTNTLTNKTLTNPKLTGAGAGVATLVNANNSSSVTVTLPSEGASNITLVSTSATQTLASKTLTTPTIASFTNATHNHTNAAGGGQITDAALSSAVTVAKGGTGATTLTSGNFLQGNGTSAVTATKVVPSGVVVGNTDTQTLTNKRINPRTVSTTSSGTPTPNSDTTDVYILTAQAATAAFANPTGTPVDGQRLLIRIKDNGTACSVTWGTAYSASGLGVLITTTVASKTHLIGFIWDNTAAKWVCSGSDPTGY